MEEFKKAGVWVKTLVTSLIVAAFTSVITNLATKQTITSEMAILRYKIDEISTKMVTQDKFEPTKIQTIENKNRINENRQLLNDHRVHEH